MTAGDPRGYYEILGIDRTASADEIRQAFRERAKRFHPDRGGTGEDEVLFRRLREAFETLRDPQRRLRYDAEGLRSGQRRPSAAGRSVDDDALGGDLLARLRRHADDALAWLRQRRGRPTARHAARWAPTAVALLLAVLVWHRLAGQDRAITALTQRVDAALQAAAERERSSTAARPVATTMAVRFQGELVFPRGLAELEPTHRARAEQVMHGLRQAVAALPENGGWTVLILAQARQVAEPRGGLAVGWDLVARRIGAASAFLIARGVPAERISARLQAGPLPAEAPSVPEALQLRLLCCESAGGPG